MSNRSDTLHRIRRNQNAIKEVTQAIQKVAITAPYSARVLQQEKARLLGEVEQDESLAEVMGWQ